MKRQLALLLALLLVAGGFAWGLVRLFSLRSAAGDALPVYSTLRADPLGTKVLFNSLREIPGVEARRHFQPLPRLQPEQPVTLFYLGLKHDARWGRGELAHFETLIATGSRAVFTFSPVSALEPGETPKPPVSDAPQVRKEGEPKGESKEKSSAETKAKEEHQAKARLQAGADEISFAQVAKQWGFAFQVPERPRDAAPPPPVANGQGADSRLETALPWHSELRFVDLKGPWKTLYQHAGQPVLIERPWGSGSIVLAADTYFLSNEALHEETRAIQLLAWLAGTPRTLIFDEEHLGLAESTGLATLMRKYHLQGLLAGLGLVAALFLWQNMVRFVPPQESEGGQADVLQGRGSSEGFLALLRRSVPPRELLGLALQEWRRSFSHDPRALERLHASYPESSAPPRKEAEIVATYGAITTALRHRRS